MIHSRYRILTVFAVAALAFGLTACDSALEEDPATFRNPDNYFETTSEVEAATNGIYQAVYDYNGFKFPTWADAACENDFTHCFSWFGGGMTGAWEGKWWQGRQWNGYYTLITRANTVLQNVPDSPVSQDVKDWSIGQARFLRGYAYYSLAIRYGDVPVRDRLYEPAQGEYGDAERDPVHEVFQQAVTDLKEAAERLPKDYASYQRGRPTAAAAQGLLAKTYLHMGGEHFTQERFSDEPRWYDETLANNQQAYIDSARIWAGRVVSQAENNSFPALEDNYMDLFDTATQDQSNEMLFSIQAAAHSGGAGNAQGSELPQYYNPNGLDIDGSRFHGGLLLGAVQLRYQWVQSQAEEDDRFEVGTALHDSWLRYKSDPTYVKEAIPSDLNYSNGSCDPDFSSMSSVKQSYEGVTYYVNDAFCNTADGGFIRVSPRYFTAKYIDPDANTKFENGSNPIILRYADVLLIYAEALARTGNQSEAFTQLNKVRERAGVAYSDMSDLPSNTSLVEAIWAERARELYAEQDRRWDLLRQGRYLSRMAAVGKSRQPFRRLLPLPSTEINGNAEIDTNNPGY